MIFKKFSLTNLRRKIYSSKVKKSLNLSDVTLISMNCIGGVMYHDCGQKFLSPTVNLYFLPGDFIKFVNNLDYYLSISPVVSIEDKDYPVGTLDDIKVYFMHYESCEEALNKWEERKKRINKNKIFVLMIERDGFSDKNFEDFKKIKYPKMLFTRAEKYSFEDSLYLPKYRNLDQLPDIIPGRYMYDEMKLIKAIKKAYD